MLRSGGALHRLPEGGGHTHHASLGVPLPAVAEGGGQGGGAALVVQGRPAVVDGRVDGDGPHAGGVAITVAVVVAATVPGGPHIDAAFAASALGEASGDRERGHQVPHAPAPELPGSRPGERAAGTLGGAQDQGFLSSSARFCPPAEPLSCPWGPENSRSCV